MPEPNGPTSSRRCRFEKPACRACDKARWLKPEMRVRAQYLKAKGR